MLKLFLQTRSANAECRVIHSDSYRCLLSLENVLHSQTRSPAIFELESLGTTIPLSVFSPFCTALVVFCGQLSYFVVLWIVSNVHRRYTEYQISDKHYIHLTYDRI